MALTALIAAVMPFLTGAGLIDSVLSNPLYLALDAANLLLLLLVYLKFLLPGWEPHRKTLGWLLGAAILCGTVFSAYATVQGFSAGVSAAEATLGGEAAIAGILRVSAAIGVALGALAGIATNPFLYLLVGTWTKKSMEKLAGVFAAVSLAMGMVAIPFTLVAGSLAEGVIAVPATLWTVTLPGLVSSLCAVIFYFTWPVLDRPVLEKT